MTLTDLPITLTRKLVDFAIPILSGLEDKDYAPTGPVYWSRKDTADLLALLGSVDCPDYGAIHNLTGRQKEIINILLDVYDRSLTADEYNDIVTCLGF